MAENTPILSNLAGYEGQIIDYNSVFLRILGSYYDIRYAYKCDNPIKEKIISELKRIEQEEQIKILFAVESGSRAWGFPSKDSDYDARFVYIYTLRMVLIN
ncbi:nucleotidyltransferase domain-containing protein [Proteiniborus sp.]|uniref:DNA polymerase beta superfamily protein n=1 Tax=Proteiniborus sp. TaxID=2079015 RepID=UPI00332FC44F